MKFNQKEVEFEGRYWKGSEGGVSCLLCPQTCLIGPGQRGDCYVRVNRGGRLVLETYGRSSGFAVDPIEKKPLYHYYPASPILSFGTAGCNLKCSFCQNWSISKAQNFDRLTRQASPAQIAAAASKNSIGMVAFTYNDPVIFLEYAADTALACRQNNIRCVAVTAGYINKKPRREFFSFIDAANIDLKAFSESFYQEQTGASLKNVLDTLAYVREQTEVWLELTTLLIPGYNDSTRELEELCGWIEKHLGADTPLHFSAFHPDYKLTAAPPTPLETLTRARKIGLDRGLRYVYTGNVHDKSGGSTYCPGCRKLVIERDWFRVGEFHIKAAPESPQKGHNSGGTCSFCNASIAGHFNQKPGAASIYPYAIDI